METPTAPTPTHALGPVVAFGPSETSIGGHEVRCSCGLRMATSLSARMAQVDGDHHLAYWYAEGATIVAQDGRVVTGPQPRRRKAR
jgi:hypothetical protein